MCGRFTLRTPTHQLAEAFRVAIAPEIEARYNIAPTQPVAVVRIAEDGKSRQFALLRWGLIPSWSKEAEIGNRLINARSETVAEKPSFRAAFKARRCLVLADGFYEWQKQGAKKQPHYIGLADGGPFAIAGLWETWKGGGEPLETCTLLTTEANDRLKTVHDRMPVILDPADYDLWLDAKRHDAQAVAPLLRPFPAEQMRAYPVSLHVNSPRNDDPECVAPQESRSL